MNPVIKEQWVSALRSEKFMQGKGLLRSSKDRFCCLGVLCEIAVSNGVIPKPTFEEDNKSYLYDGWNGGFLPMVVAEWAGLGRTSDPTVRIVGRDRKYSLAEVNDKLKLNFNEIANIIEEQL